MEIKFTTEAEQILNEAETYALKCGSMLESLHLLCGLTAVQQSKSAVILAKFGFFLDNAEQYLLQRNQLTSGHIIVSPITRQLIASASVISSGFGKDEIDSQHLLLAILQNITSNACKVLHRYNINYDIVCSAVESFENFSISNNSVSEDTKKKEKEKNDDSFDIFQFGVDLTEKAQKKELDKKIIRNREIARLFRVLCRKSKNNPILVGESGTGKTSIIECLAQKIIENDVPEFLSGRRIFALNLAGIVSGTRYRGDLEEKVTALFSCIEEKNYILFIDDLHTIMNAGNSENGLNLASLLKPILSTNVIVIGTTTNADYKKYIETDSAFERRFTKINIEPSSIELTEKMIIAQKRELEEHYHITLSDEIIRYTVKLADRYISERYLPDKAFDLLEETCGQLYLDKKNSIQTSDLENIVSEITGIPAKKLSVKETEKLVSLEKILSKKIIGQEKAIKEVSSAIRRAYVSIERTQKPIATFLFIGPTGVGKTQTAKSLAEILFGSENNLIRFDMSEFSEKNSVSKLIGSAPGYVGYEEGGRLTDAVRNRPFSVLLFDEIEKADYEIYNLLLQVLDDGRLTDAKGRTVDFSHTLIIMTSNIGTKESKKKTSGFLSSDDNDEKLKQKEAMKNYFPPEFVNRIDNIIVFNRMNKENLISISNNILEGIKTNLKNERGIELKVKSDVVLYLIEKINFEEYGVRPLKRIIVDEIEDRISLLILKDNIKNCSLEISLSNGSIKIKTKECKVL